MKRCPTCEETKPRAAFALNRSTRDGRQTSCRVCKRKHQAEWYARHRGDQAGRVVGWRTAKPDRYAASSAKRRAQQKRATPAWADRELMAEIYEFARLRTRLTGVPWCVDHEYPILGETVCGLHVPENLRVVPVRVNSSKHTKMNYPVGAFGLPVG